MSAKKLGPFFAGVLGLFVDGARPDSPGKYVGRPSSATQRKFLHRPLLGIRPQSPVGRQRRTIFGQRRFLKNVFVPVDFTLYARDELFNFSATWPQRLTSHVDVCW